jgi:ABC-type lipoprotein release transport system permease subunit
VIFGHQFTLDVNSSLLVLVLLGAVGISVLSAMASAAVAVRETAIKSIRNLEDEPEPPIDVDRVLGDR